MAEQRNHESDYGAGAAADQSVDHRHDRHAGHVHGGARLLHRQRRAAAHRRHARRQLGREHLGHHQLPGVERDRAADERLALERDWPQALLHDLRRHLHHQFVSLRPGAEPAHAHLLPHPAGRRRRRPAAQRTGHPGRHLFRQAARHGLCHVWHGGRGRARHRPDAGRVDHRQLQLALDLPHQRAHRHPFAGAYAARRARSGISQEHGRGPTSAWTISASASSSSALAFCSTCSTRARRTTGSRRR